MVLFIEWLHVSSCIYHLDTTFVFLNYVLHRTRDVYVILMTVQCWKPLLLLKVCIGKDDFLTELSFKSNKWSEQQEAMQLFIVVLK